jgi:hypothetical protein
MCQNRLGRVARSTQTVMTSVVGYDFNFNISFEYVNTTPVPVFPVEVVDVIIPDPVNPDAGCSSFTSGFDDFEIVGDSYFNISSPSSDNVTNPTTFSVNCTTPSFYAVVELVPGATFKSVSLNFSNNLNSYKIVNPDTQCVDDIGDPSTVEDDVIEVVLEGNTIGLSAPANCNNTSNPLSVVVDVDNATNVAADINAGVGQQKIIPVKLRSSQSGNLLLARLDFKIDYTDVEGNLDLQDVISYAVGDLTGNSLPLINEDYIYVTLTDFTVVNTNGGLTPPKPLLEAYRLRGHLIQFGGRSAA